MNVLQSDYFYFLQQPPIASTEYPHLYGYYEYSGPFVAPACYAGGSRILTIRGEVEVESLQEGDEVVTHAGTTLPIVWIGHRTVDPARMARPDDYRPVRIRANAFGQNRPHRDLKLSPDHAVAFDDILIPARNLLNGVTIVRDAAEPVTYYHVELAEHALLVAEGLAAESYLDTGNRGAFINGGPAISLHPDLARQRRDEGACAPVVDSGPRLDDARRRLIAIAKDQGFVTTADPAAMLLVDGMPIEPIEKSDDSLTFAIPAGAPQSVRLLSRSSAPAWTDGTADFRQLGIAFTTLELRGSGIDMVVSSASDIFSTGFNDPESEGDAVWRWTNGDAHLPAALFAAFGGGCELTLRLRGRITYWLTDAATGREAPRLHRAG